MKRVLICVHGFMIHDDHDFNYLEKYFNEVNENPDLELSKVFLYDRLNRKTLSHKKMYQALVNHTKKYLEKGYKVTLVGYSFSCSLVARACKELNLDRVIFVSPTNKLWKTKLIFKYLKIATQNIKIRFKYGTKKARRIMEKTKLSNTFTIAWNIMLGTIKNRRYYKYVDVPCLIFKGQKDNLTLDSTIKEIGNKIKSRYRGIYMFPEYDHFFIRNDYQFKDKVYPLIIKFACDNE